MHTEVAGVDAAVSRPTPSHEDRLMRCPACGSMYTAKSRIRWWERPLLSLTGRRPYRCVSCRWRGWKNAPKSKSTS